ncbi:MAG TPA: hypothetical protein VII87_01240 [Solirubrobacteraceae bacterium]
MPYKLRLLLAAGAAGSSGGAGISTGDTSTSSSAVAGHGFFIAIQGYRTF